MVFLRAYEKKWHMDQNGRFLPETCWESSTGLTFFKHLEKQVRINGRHLVQLTSTWYSV